MGNASVSNNKKIITSNKIKKQLITKNQSNHNRSNNNKNKNKLENKNKKRDLDLFKNIDDDDLNEFNEIPKIKNENMPKIITKNYFINDENNINFLKMINNNPIKKLKNEIKTNVNSNKNKEFIKNEKEKEINLINFTLKDNSFNNDNNNENIGRDVKKINQNLFEFEANNYKYYHYNEDKKEKLKNSPNFIKNEDILTSERTINNTNSEGEFFFDNINNNKNDKLKNKNNIFNNITKYEMKKNNNNISSKGKIINLKNNKNNNSKKDRKNNKIKDTKNNKIKDAKNNKIQVKIDKIKYNKIKYRNIKAKSKQDSRNNNSIIRINNTNHNNLLLISSFLTNNNQQSKNIINKSHSSCRNNNSYNIKKYNNNYKNYSFKNLTNKSQNINTNINTYKENNKLKINKDNNCSTKINSNSNKISSNDFSYNCNNFYICNEYGNNLYEKQKMAELIEKIPNNELKNEIMNLYQKIINYNNEIIINNKNSNFDYIITFSNNYMKINENTFIKKEFNKDNFYIKNQIKISLLSKKNKNKIASNINYNSKKNKCINLISNITNDRKEKSNNNKKLKSKNNNNNLILNNIDNESIFKQYTFEQYKKSGNKKINSAKTNLEHNSSDINPKIKSIYTVNYSSLKKDNNKIKINKVNKAWKKIINLSEVTINKDKIFPLEKSNYNLMKTDIININGKRSNSITFILNKDENNYLNREKTSKSINFKDFNKFEKFYTFTLGQEKIIFQKNMKKLINVNNLMKDLKKYQKNYIFKEEDLIIFNVICFISKEYIIIFKDKEKDYPLFKEKINLMKKIMSFRKNRKFIIIIEFGDLNQENGIKYHKEDKDKYLGLLIEKEKNYNEFIDILTQLSPNLEIIFLN